MSPQKAVHPKTKDPRPTSVLEKSRSDDPSPGDRGRDESPDELWMEEALRCAQRALEAGEVPVGAVVVCEGRVVGRGWNRNITDSDPTATPRSLRCARLVLPLVTTVWETAICLLQLNRAPCARERWFMRVFGAWYTARTTPKPARCIR